jgi:hypothetical protein
MYTAAVNDVTKTCYLLRVSTRLDAQQRLGLDLFITPWRDRQSKENLSKSLLSTLLLLKSGDSFHTCCYYGLVYTARFRGRFSSVKRYPLEITPSA